MSSKRNSNDANRDALFGPPKTKTGPKHKRENASNRDALFGGMEQKKAGSKTAKTRAAKPPAPSSAPTARGYTPRQQTKQQRGVTSTLSGAAKVAKLKEAEDFRDKATAAMQRGVFTRPDPMTAANYYKRSAEAYGLCGENRLERLHRVASADCQMGTGSFPAAAAEYLKAGSLVKATTEDIEIERRRKEGWKFYQDAATAWERAGEPGKAAQARVQGALAWTWGDETTMLDRQALSSLEESIEAHVPDIVNQYARYRQTGISKYVDPENPNEDPSPEAMSLAQDHMVKTPYAHEGVQQVAYALTKYGEYQSALYATGAASHMLESDGISSLTLSRSYVMETVLTLAMGDPVMAQEQFLNRHVQSTQYLTTRECKLAEDLYRCILNRDAAELEEVRSPAGSNKSALANLHSSTRNVVKNLRVSGAARRSAPAMTTTMPAGGSDSEEEVEPPAADKKKRKDKKVEKVIDDEPDVDQSKLDNEMDDLMAGLDELDALGGNDDDDSFDDDDDDVDLR